MLLHFVSVGVYVFETSVLYDVDQDETIGPRNAIGTYCMCVQTHHGSICMWACDINIRLYSTKTTLCSMYHSCHTMVDREPIQCFSKFLQLVVATASTVWANLRPEFNSFGNLIGWNGSLFLQPVVARTWKNAILNGQLHSVGIVDFCQGIYLN